MGLAAGQIVLDTDLSAVSAASNLKPVVRVYNNASQSIPHNTLTAVTFNAEDFDTHGFHSTSVNPTRVQPTRAGIYKIAATIFLSGSTTYTLQRLLVRKNGATQYAPSTNWGNLVTATTSSWTCQLYMAFDGVSDYIEACVLQTNTASAAVTVLSSNPNICVLEMEYVRDPA